jgi:regulator of protease activity HflC (stomatin/prohibitin superfamily)
MTFVLAALGLLALAALAGSLQIVREYERAVVFRLGRLLPVRGPGVVTLLPLADRMVRVDLRTITLTIPPQELITRDNVPARVAAVCYFRVLDPAAAVTQIEAFAPATSQIAQTTLRSVLGGADLDELLTERERRAKVINAEGELQAAEKLAGAARIIDREPSALQLRYLQTLLEVGAEESSTVVFGLPLDVAGFAPAKRRRASP